MNSVKINYYITFSLAIYFGWLLSFPFYGPVLSAAAPLSYYQGFSLPFIFTFFHALAFLLGGLLLKDAKNIWKKLMTAGLIVTIAVNTALPFLFRTIWPWAMVVLGVFTAVYILGWTYPYSVFLPAKNRLKLMAAIMIGGNVIFIVFNILAQIITPGLLLVLVGVPLWVLLPLSLFNTQQPKPEKTLSLSTKKSASFPAPLLFVFCLVIAGLYLCSGFMYNIMHPFLSGTGTHFTYFRYILYVAVLVIMLLFGERLPRYFPIYMGASLLGLAFVSFALLYQYTAGLVLTTSLIEAAYAFLDIFIWTTLGHLSFIYGAPFQLFGFALAVMVFSILTGGLLGEHLLQLGEHYRLITALFAAAAIFLTFTAIPWLSERMNWDYGDFLSQRGEKMSGAGEEPLQKALKLLQPGEKLTPRETEITALLLKGLTNRAIAEQLFISENTLKTHLKHIYPKFGITQKKELLALVAGEQKDNSV